MPITRTNSKRYIAVCGHAGCDWSDRSRRNRIESQQELNHHNRTEHLSERIRHAMKQATGSLPEQKDQLSNYADHLVVFSNPRKLTNTQYGRDALTCSVDVFIDGGWKQLGDLGVYWQQPVNEIAAANGEPIAGILQQGTMRNEREWALVPVPKQAKDMHEALKSWDDGTL